MTGAKALTPGPVENIGTFNSADRLLLIYIHLWIAEGALRKWLLPGADPVLYVLRDGLLFAAAPIVYFAAAPRFRRTPVSIALLGMAIVGLSIVALLQIGLTDNPIVVELLGFRSYVAPLLITALVARSCTRRGIRGAIAGLLAWLPVQAVLTLAQVASPHASFVNQIAPGEYQAIAISGEIYRATGTFTAPIGLTTYATVAFALSLACFVEKDRQWWKPPRLLVTLSLLSAVTIIALSGSRSLITAAGAVLVALILCTRPGAPQRMVGVLACAGLVVSSCLLLVPEVLAAFNTRVADAAQHENLATRIIDGMFGYLTPTGASQSILGDGLGAHAIFAPTYGVTLGWIEPDLLRIASEAGLLGLALAAVRTGLATYMLVCLWRKTWRASPMRLALSAALIPVLYAGSVVAQPSTQGGFAVALALWIWWGDEEQRERHLGVRRVSFHTPDEGGRGAVTDGARVRPVGTRSRPNERGDTATAQPHAPQADRSP